MARYDSLLTRKHVPPPRAPPPNTRGWRAAIYAETARLAPTFEYAPSEKIRYDPTFHVEKRYAYTPITLTGEDTLVAGKRLADGGFTPLMLNFANDRRPGGGVASGAGAQEESLFRRTNLCETLRPDMYPIRDNEGIYTPRATVFRDTERNGCEMLGTPWVGSFCTVPGLFHPRVSADGRLGRHDVARLEQKIHTICQMGVRYGHDMLVLGALGCGAWGNPPTHVAEIFRKVLAHYDGAFREVVFAIYDRVDTDDNFSVFSRVLLS